MIYLDTSAAIAHLLAEDRCPPSSLWKERLVSSRLLQYELWVRIHARGLAKSHSEAVSWDGAVRSYVDYLYELASVG